MVNAMGLVRGGRSLSRKISRTRVQRTHEIGPAAIQKTLASSKLERQTLPKLGQAIFAITFS